MEVQIARGGEVLGTYPISNIPTLVASGSILTSDHYWHEGMNDWAPVGNTWQTTTPQKAVIANSAKLSVLAIVAIALGILALPLALIVIGVVLAIGAIVCGHLALSAAKRDQSSISRNVALTGVVLGYSAVAISSAATVLQFTNSVVWAKKVQNESEETLACARVEMLNLAVAAYFQAVGNNDTAMANWTSAATDEARYSNFLKPYIAFPSADLSAFMPSSQYKVVFDKNNPLSTKAKLYGPRGQVPY